MAKRKPATDRKKKGQLSRKGRTAKRKYSLAEWFGFGDEPSPKWASFARKYPGHSALDDDTHFYQRWCIHTFATWDLPIPMWAGIATPIFYLLAQVSEAGMALFMPWYLLRDQTFKLQDLAKHERFSRGPDHLQGWFSRDRNRWGHERLGTMLKIYVFMELCLKKRYTDRISRRTEELDYCLSRFPFQNPDTKAVPMQDSESIRKIRLEMGRRLKSCLAPESSGQTS